MALLILAFWLCIIGFAAYIAIQAAGAIPMPTPFPAIVHGIIIIVALIMAFNLLQPYIPL